MPSLAGRGRRRSWWRPRVATLALGGLLLAPLGASGQPAPVIGQEGKDVIWVPTPDVLVDTMLEMAEVGPGDYVMDLGSGDGRTVIAAARLGARTVGVELDPGLVAASTQRAIEAGVADRTEFLATDLFEVDLSGDGDHDVPAPGHQHPTATPPVGTRAGHPHRVEHLGHGRFGERPRRARLDPGRDRRPRSLSQLLHLAVLGRAGERDGNMAPGRSGADAELELAQEFQMVSGSLRRNGRTEDVDEGRLRGRDQLPDREHELPWPCRRRHHDRDHANERWHRGVAGLTSQVTGCARYSHLEGG